MSSCRLLLCLSGLEWSDRELAQRLDTHQATTTRYASGHLPIPDDVAI